MIVRPAPGAYFVPELRLFRTGNAYRDVGGMLRDASFNRAVENVADLRWPVPAGAKQAQGRNADQRTHFMKHRRSTVEKEAFDPVERGGRQFLEEAKSKTLSCRRPDPVKDRGCACALNPFATAVGKYTAARPRALKAHLALGTPSATGNV